ncbi:MAG: endonuclease/exonuclease/phosphatase family protein, partial [Rubricoccaceae bacterium]|nr:endonuclease/exonuclease/phosphatase family protein [Rubricoccaceae bacterium]
QGNELLNVLDDANEPVILLGDFNSGPDDTGSDRITYDSLTDEYMDAWVEAGGSNGFTCCQDPLIRNTTSELSSRIDLVLYRGDVEATAVALVGEDPADMTSSGVWPSDHAGVVSTLTVRN